jgi:hypothetical protein
VRLLERRRVVVKTTTLGASFARPRCCCQAALVASTTRSRAAELAGKAAAADHALRAACGAFAKPAIRRDEPVRAVVLRRLADDPVVGRFGPLEDELDVDALALAPGLDELDELLARDVGPLRAADVLRVDEDGRTRVRQRAALRSRG